MWETKLPSCRARQLEASVATLVPPCLYCPRFPNLYGLAEILDLKAKEETPEECQPSLLQKNVNHHLS